MIGAVLDETYRVLERVGEGSMGEVFLVEHLKIGRREAVKVLRAEMATDSRLAARFRREARAINRLRHPNIIGIYDFGQLPDGRLYLTMEYARGALLDQVLRDARRFDVPRALHVVHQLAGAIDHAHAQGVVHRDLKPNNMILVEELGRPDVVKVLDFGLAKVLGLGPDSELTMRGELFGTPEYLAPERMAGGADDARSDLYAIGCILFELLTGAPPFTGPRPIVMSAHLQTAPPAPGRFAPGVPPILDAIVAQLLAKDPADRIQSARQLAAALEEVPGFPRRRPWSIDPARGIAFADTATAAGADVRDEIFGALDELARVTLEHAPARADDDLSVTLAKVTAIADDRARLVGERMQLEDQQIRAQQTAREREGSLRFAIAELRFERQKAARAVGARDVLADLDYQIEQLETRVRELTAELHYELSRIEQTTTLLTAAELDLDQRWIDLHRKLRGSLAFRLGTLGPSAAALSGRFAQIGGAMDEMMMR